ncbi:TetR/AcrR family transcriptional regulator, cholesterol catabolism regulator [Frankia sp. AiPs1]|uniref:TetR/AcrR family transcriptional regulator n=1 Tax=Frankia sp. AiPa1 TaxID=573492 RepID=UPI00202B49C7|nr:TetR/AcrR family transcriptional regulator [Frankia sp. AiPa1]MCL9760042.1 TetR/AcrR family transcriptional regulator [Frankia sp. AiPa1]
MTDVQVRRSAKWELRRRAIIDTSARVFARRGFHATSTAELCEANEVGKGALYYYIGSKEQLLVAIHDRVMDEVMLGADRVATAGGTPPERLARLGTELLHVIHRYPDHVWVFLHEFPALTGTNAETFRDRRREYETRVEQVLEEGRRSGDFRAIDAPMASKAWLGMHNYTYLWMRTDGRVAVEDLAAQYADIFVRGIASGPVPGPLADPGHGAA